LPRSRFGATFCLLALWAALPVPAWVEAQELATPQGDVILTVTGSIGRTSDGSAALFDLAGLKALPSRTITTSTPWTEGTHTYVGVGGTAFVEAIGASGGEALATALNDYQVTIPLEDFGEDHLIIAYEADGEPMSIRDKGPLWVIYPYDDDARYREDAVASRSIWQLKSLAFQ